MTTILKLYVAGVHSGAEEVLDRLRKLLETAGHEPVEAAVVDVLADPGTAEERKILATPTLVKEWPLPVRKVIGDFSDLERVAEFLGLKNREAHAGRITK